MALRSSLGAFQLVTYLAETLISHLNNPFLSGATDIASDRPINGNILPQAVVSRVLTGDRWRLAVEHVDLALGARLEQALHVVLNGRLQQLDG